MRLADFVGLMAIAVCTALARVVVYTLTEWLGFPDGFQTFSGWTVIFIGACIFFGIFVGLLSDLPVTPKALPPEEPKLLARVAYLERTLEEFQLEAREALEFYGRLSLPTGKEQQDATSSSG